MKIVKIFVSTFLMFVLSFLIIGYILFFGVQDVLNLKGDYVLGNVVSASIEDTAKEFVENENTITPEIVHKYADDELIKRGIPVGLVDYVLREDNYVEMFETYKKESIDYIIGNGIKPIVPVQRINGMIDRGTEKYNKDNRTRVVVTGLKEKVVEVGNEVDDMVEKIANDQDVNTVSGLLKNKTINIVLIGSILVCVILLIYFNEKFLFLIYLGLSFLFSGVLSLLIKDGFNKKDEILDKLRDLLGSEVRKFQDILDLYGFILIVLGILFLFLYILYFVIKKIRSKKCPKKMSTKK